MTPKLHQPIALSLRPHRAATSVERLETGAEWSQGATPSLGAPSSSPHQVTLSADRKTPVLPPLGEANRIHRAEALPSGAGLPLLAPRDG
jgi:hypothetical protein